MRNPEVRRRLLARARQALPGGRVQAVLPGEFPAEDAELVCAVRRAGDSGFADWKRMGGCAFRSPAPLHEMLGVFGALFRETGVFHHVGGRLCLRRVPQWREEIWARPAVSGRVKPAFASFFAVAWITAGGLGFLPIVGATAASLATALAAGLVGSCWEGNAVRVVMGAVCVVASIAGVLVERASERHFLSDDAREFVLDEVAGMALALVFVPVSAGWWGVALAFGLFRFFDVVKPGIKWIERRSWRGKIVWDDLLAGLYAGVAAAALLSLAR